MLQQTFVHIPGIGRRTELRLWESGITSWDDAERFEKRFGVAGARLQRKLDEYIPLSRAAVGRKDASFFGRLSALGESWRMYPEFSESCLYLDVETTGLSPVFDSLTVVGLYDGRCYKVFVQGKNLDELPAHLKGYSLLVTFNGAAFDLRFLRLAFEDLALPPVHIDLRWAARALGVGGGLKAVEEAWGLRRPSRIEGTSGHDAVVLWARHLRDEEGALEQLIEYNRQDVVHLKPIAEIAHDKLFRQTAGRLMKAHGSLFTSVPRAPGPTNRFKLAPSAPPAPRSSGALVPRLLGKTRAAGKGQRIVGIDLTGSEKRATGWVFMDGARATIKSIRTDEELISQTLGASPSSIGRFCERPSS